MGTTTILVTLFLFSTYFFLLLYANNFAATPYEPVILGAQLNTLLFYQPPLLKSSAINVYSSCKIGQINLNSYILCKELIGNRGP